MSYQAYLDNIIVEPATPERFDIGHKLKGVAPAGRL
jgi:hypothetical protein